MVNTMLLVVGYHTDYEVEPRSERVRNGSTVEFWGMKFTFLGFF